MEVAFVTFMVIIGILGTYASLREWQRDNEKKKGERDRYHTTRNY